MCLIAMFYRVVEDAPLIIAANREETYARGGEPPRLLDGNTRAVAGIDPVAGGTWFGVNEHGVVVAVTNRPKTFPPEKPRSRGLLVRELLGSLSAAVAARRAAEELSKTSYAGCNILCADSSSATVIHAADWLRVRPLPPGLHLLTSHDVDDASDRRLGHAHWWLLQRAYGRAEECLDALKELCGQTGNHDPPICLHGKDRGTVSSSIVCLRRSLADSVYLHAQGPPDRTPYQDYSPLLHDLGQLQRRK
jgi:uncharacterized protein with NRDE domain